MVYTIYKLANELSYVWTTKRAQKHIYSYTNADMYPSILYKWNGSMFSLNYAYYDLQKCTCFGRFRYTCAFFAMNVPCTQSVYVLGRRSWRVSVALTRRQSRISIRFCRLRCTRGSLGFGVLGGRKLTTCSVDVEIHSFLGQTEIIVVKVRQKLRSVLAKRDNLDEGKICSNLQLNFTYWILRSRKHNCPLYFPETNPLSKFLAVHPNGAIAHYTSWNQSIE